MTTHAASAAGASAAVGAAEFAPAPYVRPQLADLDAKHRALIQEYLIALEVCRSIPRFSFRLGFRSLVRVMARAHVRRRITQASQGYAFIEQTFGPGQDESDRDYAAWVKEAQEQLDRLARALPLRAGVLTALSPAALIPLLAALAKIDLSGVGKAISVERVVPADLQWIAWPTLALAFVYSVGYLTIFVQASFNTKRRFFHADVSPRTRFQRLLGIREEQRPLRDGSNVYELERQLFEVLPTRRDPEFPLDLALRAAYGVVAFIIVLTVLRALPNGIFVVDDDLEVIVIAAVTAAATIWGEMRVVASWRARSARGWR